MVKIADIIQDKVDEPLHIPGAEPEAAEPETPAAGIGGLSLGWLKTPTGEGSIDSYLDHPLNVNRSLGLAQVLRGATGFAGDLKLAVVDILMGLMNFSKERRKGAAANVQAAHTVQH